MGRIVHRDNQVIVVWPIEEVILYKAYIHPPTEDPPEDGMMWYNYIGGMIMDGAWKLLEEKAPHLAEKKYAKTTLKAAAVGDTFNLYVIYEEEI